MENEGAERVAPAGRPARAGDVLSDWHQLLEGVQESSLEFYQRIERALETREIPQSTRSRVDWREGGGFSARREYLRVARARLVLDICGAPFGRGFFVSWWLAEARPSLVVPTIGASVAIVLLWWILSAIGGTTLALLGVVGTFVGLGIFMSQGEEEWHARLLAIPILGWLWERLFLPPTYYRIDTALMFQEAVHHAVLEVVDGLLSAKGLRALSELERKPILREFFRQR